MNFAGIDIGGAHTKLATTQGDARQIPFPIWRAPSLLESVLSEIELTLSGPYRIGVTMTAELADCFGSKQEGVEHIVRAVSNAFTSQSPLFYQLSGDMCPAATAIQQWESVAASNWHALAWHAFQNFETDSGFLFDIGSTTSDIIPVMNGMPVISDQTDFDRLSNCQLLYAGIGRTPVCSLLDNVQLESSRASIAREWFATMADVFLWLRQIPPDPESTETADGRSATRFNAGRRLARMLCLDNTPQTIPIIDAIAVQARDRLIRQLSICLTTVTSHHPAVPRMFRISGSGAWLARDAIVPTFASIASEVEYSIRPISGELANNQTAPAMAVALKRKQIYHANRN